MDRKYSRSTFSRAHSVLRRNFKLDLIDGSLLKQLIRMRSPSSSQPYCSTKCSSISASFTPCNGLLGWLFAGFSAAFSSDIEALFLPALSVLPPRSAIVDDVENDKTTCESLRFDNHKPTLLSFEIRHYLTVVACR